MPIVALPQDRPVSTRDVCPFFGLRPRARGALHSTSDVAWLLGLNAAGWSAIIRSARSAVPAPLLATQAILLRWLEAHPEALLHHLGCASPLRLREELLRSGLATTLKEFGLAFGCDASAGSRWVREGSGRADPAVRRACAALLAGGADGLGDRWRAWTAFAGLEARLRGFGPLGSFSTWCPPGAVFVPRPRGSAGQGRPSLPNSAPLPG